MTLGLAIVTAMHMEQRLYKLWGEFYTQKSNLTPYWVAFKHDIAKTDPYPSQAGIITNLLRK